MYDEPGVTYASVKDVLHSMVGIRLDEWSRRSAIETVISHLRKFTGIGPIADGDINIMFEARHSLTVGCYNIAATASVLLDKIIKLQQMVHRAKSYSRLMMEYSLAQEPRFSIDDINAVSQALLFTVRQSWSDNTIIWEAVQQMTKFAEQICDRPSRKTTVVDFTFELPEDLDRYESL